MKQIIHRDPQPPPIAWTWPRQARRILAMAGMGYVFFWMNVVPYYFLAHAPGTLLVQALWGGVFLTFGVLVPAFLGLAWIRHRLVVWAEGRRHSGQAGRGRAGRPIAEGRNPIRG
jgi:hypothetical protein